MLEFLLSFVLAVLAMIIFISLIQLFAITSKIKNILVLVDFIRFYRNIHIYGKSSRGDVIFYLITKKRVISIVYDRITHHLSIGEYKEENLYSYHYLRPDSFLKRMSIHDSYLTILDFFLHRVKNYIVNKYVNNFEHIYNMEDISFQDHLLELDKLYKNKKRQNKILPFL